MDEFEVIKKFFLPLAAKESSINLDDDAAILSIKNKSIIISTDSITEDDHFQKNEKDPKVIAQKLLRVNLSDIASMGADPFGYTLNLSVPNKLKKTQLISWIKNFSKGLKIDQQKYNIKLLGGDTVSTKGNLIMSLTAFGVARNNILKRSGAKVGDDIYVTGNIGDSGIGYGILEKKIKLNNKKFSQFYIKKHKIPDPPVDFGKKIGIYASSCTDISDGFLADLNNLISSSKCGAEIIINTIPFTKQTKELINKKIVTIEYVLSSGEDYQLFFTAKKKFSNSIKKLAYQSSTKISKIGRIIKKRDLLVLNSKRQKLSFKVLGFKHF